MLNKRHHISPKGFTLIEILVAIAIIGILATVIFMSISGARGKARDAVRLSDTRELSKALELYNNEHGHYPVMLATSTQCATTGNWIADNGNYNWSAAYISSQPRDPAESCLPPVQAYTYQSNGLTYNIGITLEATKDPLTGEGQAVTFNGTSFQKNLTQFTVTFSSSAGSPTNENPIPITVTFSAPASSFSESDLNVQGGIISAFIRVLDTIFSFLLTPFGSGAVEVTLPQNTILSDQGSPNAGGGYSNVYDDERPHISLSPDPLPDPAPGAFTVFVNSTLPISGLSGADVSVTNGSVSGFGTIPPENGMNYSFTVTPSGSGAITIVIPDGAAQTSAGNTNIESNPLTTSF